MQVLLYSLVAVILTIGSGFVAGPARSSVAKDHRAAHRSAGLWRPRGGRLRPRDPLDLFEIEVLDPGVEGLALTFG